MNRNMSTVAYFNELMQQGGKKPRTLAHPRPDGRISWPDVCTPAPAAMSCEIRPTKPCTPEIDEYECEEEKDYTIKRGNAGPAFRDWLLTFWPEAPSTRIIRPKSTKYVKYYTGQLEVCPDTKRLHGHIYIELSAPRTRNFLKDLFDNKTMHCEPRKGTQKQAIAYCTKEDTRAPDCIPYEWGERKEQGHRSDLDNLAAAACQGMTTLEILRMFKGNALRHLGCIERAQRAAWGRSEMDNYIMNIREQLGSTELDPRETQMSEDSWKANRVESAVSRLQRLRILEDGDEWDDETLTLAEQRREKEEKREESSEQEDSSSSEEEEEDDS